MSNNSLSGAIGALTDPMVIMQRVVDESLVLVPSADGAVVELAIGNSLIYACAAGNLAKHLGLRLRVKGSLSGLAMTTGRTLRSDDTRTDERVNAEACAKLDVRSMVCVPLRRGVERVGVLKVTASRPHVFGGDQVALLARLADFITWAVATISELSRLTSSLRPSATEDPGSSGGPGTVAKAASAMEDAAFASFVGNVLQPGLVASSHVRDRVAEVLAEGSLLVACQPIVNLVDGRIAGVEALARFPSHPGITTEEWFHDAAKVGLSLELELAAARKALALLDVLPSEVYLSVNAGPEAVLDLADLLDGVDCRRIVVELTEHVEVENYPRLSVALQHLRRLGLRLAVDDTGAGFASFNRILSLAPDVIKLDRALTNGIDLDPVRRALASALVAFAADSGASVVAEGIETSDELQVVKDIGIRFGQGYHLGRPGAVGDLRTEYLEDTGAGGPRVPSTPSATA